MQIYLQASAVTLLMFCALANRACAQAPAGSAILESIRTDGSRIPEAQIVAEMGLKNGDLVTKDQLQLVADRLGHLGLFEKVNYEYHTRVDGLSLVFHLKDAPRVPVLFDNIPWFTDTELGDAIRKSVPYFDGTAPEQGSLLDRIGEAVTALLAAHQRNVAIEREVIANPLGNGNVLQYRISGASVRIARMEFSDPQAANSRALQQHLSEIVGKPYSRLTIDLFLAEQVRPIYLQQGYLKAQIGPPDIRLTGNPNLPLPDSLPVYIPVAAGAQYHWNGAHWSGNTLITAAALTGTLGMHLGEIANALEIEAGLDRVRDEYGRLGYLDTKLEPRPVFDDAAQKVAYQVSVREGQQYRCGQLVLTGVSLAAEKLIRARWPIAKGEVFDKVKYEDFLSKLDRRSTEIFGELPIHYDQVGHWLQIDAQKGTVDVLLDFK